MEKSTQPIVRLNVAKDVKLKMWASAHYDGRPAEYRWRPLFNAHY